MSTQTFRGVYREGGAASHYARITAANGSGDATGIEGEGRYLEQADITSIELKVTDKATGEVVVAATSLSVSAVVIDTPVTSTEVWTQGAGYNFKHDMPIGSFPDAGKTYRTQYKITLSGGSSDPLFLIFEGPAWKTD